MLLLEAVAVGLLLLLVPFAGIYLRRRLLQRGGGTVEMSLRLRTPGQGRGWAYGVGRFEGAELRWYRVFSLAPGPRRRLSRRDLQVLRHRAPEGGEKRALLQGVTILECRGSRGDVQLAMDAAAVTGFLAWLEATPPGTVPR